MKTKLVLWGANAQEEKLLVAVELIVEENKVKVYTFPETAATEEFYQKMLKEWRVGSEVPFPEGYATIDRTLNMTDSLLPDDIKVERSDLVLRAQTEWQFIVLSAKLSEAYKSELEDIKEKVNQLNAFDSKAWEELKGFWNKVQEQVRERNLFREHANYLRETTNELFAELKGLRSRMDDQFKESSKVNYDEFMSTIEDIEKRISEGLRLRPIFDELKQIQRKFKDTKFTREHRGKVWDRLDAAFKTVKEKRFGPSSGEDKSSLDRINRRYNGLLAAIEKMERSIHRDREDLKFQNRKIASTDGQLEAQIRQAKTKMIEERIRSKEEKLKEMLQTKSELELRIETEKKKEEKRQEKVRIEEAKKEAEAKIQEKIKHEVASRADSSEILEKAADAITGKEEKEEQPADATTAAQTEVAAEEPVKMEESTSTTEEQAATREDTLTEALSNTLGDAFEDVIDTIKAVAEVVGEKIEEAVDELKEDMKEATKPRATEEE
jgi:DNA repair exonuclease SbcCD ATPase subunit